MSKLWKYQPVFTEYTVHRVSHPDDVIASDIGVANGYEWFVAEDSYTPNHPQLTFYEVTPTQSIIDSLMINSPHAKLLQQQMLNGPPRYSAEDEARLNLYIGFIPGIAEHVATGREWEQNG